MRVHVDCELAGDVSDQSVGSHHDHHLPRERSAEFTHLVHGQRRPASSHQAVHASVCSLRGPRVGRRRVVARRVRVTSLPAAHGLDVAGLPGHQLRQDPLQTLRHAHLLAHRADLRGVPHRHRVPQPAHAPPFRLVELGVQPVVQQDDLDLAGELAATTAEWPPPTPSAQHGRLSGAHDSRPEVVTTDRPVTRLPTYEHVTRVRVTVHEPVAREHARERIRKSGSRRSGVCKQNTSSVSNCPYRNKNKLTDTSGSETRTVVNLHAPHVLHRQNSAGGE